VRSRHDSATVHANDATALVQSADDAQGVAADSLMKSPQLLFPGHGPPLHLAAIVRCLPRYRDIVDVAFAPAGGGDALEAAVSLHVLDGPIAGVAHGRAQAADELVDDVADRALVGHAAFDALRHQLERIRDLLLEIAIGGAARHGADRAHAAVG